MSRAITPEILRQTLQTAPGQTTSTVRFWVRALGTAVNAIPVALQGGFVSVRFFALNSSPTATCDWIVTADPAAIVDPAVPTAGTQVVTGGGVGKHALHADPPIEFVLVTAANAGVAAWYVAAYGSVEGWLEIVAT